MDLQILNIALKSIELDIHEEKTIKAIKKLWQIAVNIHNLMVQQNSIMSREYLEAMEEFKKLDKLIDELKIPTTLEIGKQCADTIVDTGEEDTGEEEDLNEEEDIDKSSKK